MWELKLGGKLRDTKGLLCVKPQRARRRLEELGCASISKEVALRKLVALKNQRKKSFVTSTSNAAQSIILL